MLLICCYNKIEGHQEGGGESVRETQSHSSGFLLGMILSSELS